VTLIVEPPSAAPGVVLKAKLAEVAIVPAAFFDIAA
jgi:hypothetical protein